MGDSAVMRRAALRVLYEEWNVPVDLLHQLSATTPAYLDRLMQSEGWQGGHSAASLQAKMMKSFDEQLSRFTNAIDDEPTEEKITRAFSMMAKTLESFATVSNRIATTQKLGERTKQENHSEAADSDAERNQRSTLDKQLADLFQGLEL